MLAAGLLVCSAIARFDAIGPVFSDRVLVEDGLEGNDVDRPILLPNPVADADFVAFMRACAEGADDPHELQNRLRANYPRAVVRLRVIVGEQHVVWYVYRDGRWVPDAGQ